MKLSELRKKVKKNRFIFFTYKKMTDHDYRESLKAYSANGCSKSREKIRKELQQIKDFWKCDPMHYFRYRLYEKDLTYEELIDYVPSYYFYNYHMESLYGSADTLVTDSKIKMRQLFIERGIDTPASVAIVLEGNISGISGEQLSWEKFIDILQASPAGVFFVKPDRGRGGKGIFTIKKIDGKLYDDTNLLEEKSFLRKVKQEDYLIQEGIIQRSDLKRINASSVNTLRVVTQKSGNDYRIPVVVLRIGRNKSFVDNSAQGGISVNVDVETGVLGRFAYTEHTAERFDRHPDSGFIFEGFQLRDWENVKSEIKRYASLTPEYPEIAWDIVLLENGINAIEINLQYGIDHLQCCTGGMRRKLNIHPVMIGNTVY